MEAAERDAQNLQQKPRSVLAVETSAPSCGTGGMPQPCYHCAGKHMSRDCRFKDFVCNHCGKKGNIARACRSKKDSQPKSRGRRRRSHTANVLEEEDNPTETEEVTYTDHLFHLASQKADPLTATVRVNSAALLMEIDTGASVSVISESTYRSSLWTDRERPPLQNTTARLRTYTGEPIAVLGQLEPTVEYGTQKKRLKLLVVRGDGPSLLGRDWLLELRLHWKEIRVLRSPTEQLNAILDHHRDDVPLAENRRHFRVIGGRSSVLQTRFGPCILAGPAGGELEDSRNNKRTQGTVSLQWPPVRGVRRAIKFPKDHGKFATRNSSYKHIWTTYW